jgi:hypothetical protein
MPDLNNSYRIDIAEGMNLEEAIELFSQMEGVAGVFPIPKPVLPPAPIWLRTQYSYFGLNNPSPHFFL